MSSINKKNFLQKLLLAVPEFKKIHEEESEYHNIGIHLILGDFKRLTEVAVKKKNDELLQRITGFIIRCHDNSKDEVHNAIYVTFFENMNEESLQYFLHRLPKEFAEKVKEFLVGK